MPENNRPELVFNLRVRGLTEDEIAETIDGVRAHQSAAGTPAAEEFGNAQAYAKQFPKRKMRTRGSAITVTVPWPSRTWPS